MKTRRSCLLKSQDYREQLIDTSASKNVAIVGSGAAGMAAFWALNNHSPHSVELYEADDRLGGHNNTVKFTKEKYDTYVDTGFIVLNTATYREFPAF